MANPSPILISPSLLSADFANLADQVAMIEEAGADWLHLDIMDGHFVPNITFGAPVVAAIRKVTSLSLDVHLMIADPVGYAPQFADAGTDWFTFHVEAVDDTGEAIDIVQRLGMKAGASVKPATPADALYPHLPQLDLALVMSVEPGFGGQSFMPESIAKIAGLNKAVSKSGNSTFIEVDGGISSDIAGAVVDAGVNVMVAGTAVFGAKDPKAAISSLKNPKNIADNNSFSEIST